MTSPRPLPSPAARLAYRISEAAQQLGVSRSRLYELIQAGEIKTYREGADQRVPHAELESYIERRMTEYREGVIAFEAASRTPRRR